MTQPEILDRLRRHPFLQDLTESHLAMIAQWTQPATIPAGDCLGREKQPASKFYLIESGRVAVEIQTPSRGTVRIQTIEAGEIVGWSWLVAPHQWQFDARAVEAVVALEIDGQRLREQCDRDCELGNQLQRRLIKVIAARLAATRLQLLDVFR